VSTARAVWFSGPGRAELRDEVLPEVGPGQILVRAERSAISHGTEMLVYRGEVPPETTLDLPTLAGSFAFPIKYGYASVGTVVEVGEGVAEVGPGDRVFCLHPHQTAYVVPADLAWRLPPDLDPERAVFAANVETALNVLLDTPVRIGERVAVLGQGTIGLLIGLLARRNGATRVVVVDPLERRRAAGLALGADAALAPAAGSEAIADALGGRPDLVFEASGSPGALQIAIDAVADEGTVTVCSWYGTKPVSLMLGGHFHRGRVRLHSTQVGRVPPELLVRWSYARRRSTVLDLLAELPVQRLISHRFAQEDAPAAYALLARRPEETVQVVLTYPEPSTPRERSRSHPTPRIMMPHAPIHSRSVEQREPWPADGPSPTDGPSLPGSPSPTDSQSPADGAPPTGSS
jgi:2-desacetyl-2-hydroxyethyl bacteriochlorophyllide A dehydrogenase